MEEGQRMRCDVAAAHGRGGQRTRRRRECRHRALLCLRMEVAMLRCSWPPLGMGWSESGVLLSEGVPPAVGEQEETAALAAPLSERTSASPMPDIQARTAQVEVREAVQYEVQIVVKEVPKICAASFDFTEDKQRELTLAASDTEPAIASTEEQIAALPEEILEAEDSTKAPYEFVDEAAATRKAENGEDKALVQCDSAANELLLRRTEAAGVWARRIRALSSSQPAEKAVALRGFLVCAAPRAAELWGMDLVTVRELNVLCHVIGEACRRCELTSCQDVELSRYWGVPCEGTGPGPAARGEQRGRGGTEVAACRAASAPSPPLGGAAHGVELPTAEATAQAALKVKAEADRNLNSLD